MNNKNHGTSIDFVQVAERVLRENGFDPAFESAVEAQVASTKQPAKADGLRDLRDMLWSSIDNTESRDLDQIEVAEALGNGAIRILVAIADVDALVTKRLARRSARERELHVGLHRRRTSSRCSRSSSRPI